MLILGIILLLIGLVIAAVVNHTIGAICAVIGLILIVIALVFMADARANPGPPTNGGNGAGQSGQCTGAAADRPTACQSP